MFLLFDIGATNTRLGFSTDGQNIGAIAIIPTQTDFSRAMEEITAAGKKLLQGKTPAAAAGGIAGPLDSDRSTLVNSPNLPDWKDKPLKTELEKAWATSVHLQNDTAMIGLGEAVRGAGKNHEIVAYVTVSTGIGGCRIVSGQVDQSRMGFEPGHQVIEIDGPLCACGGRGHLEAFIGGASLSKKYHSSPAEIVDPSIWDQAAKYLAIGLNNVLVFWSPNIIILGGSVLKGIDLDAVRKYFRQTVTIFSNPPLIHTAALGEKGGLYGALAYLNNLPGN